MIDNVFQGSLFTSDFLTQSIVSNEDWKSLSDDEIDVLAADFTVRAECIDQNWFLSLDDARSKCEAYRREYNEERPHSAIGNKTPVEFMKAIGQPSRQMA